MPEGIITVEDPDLDWPCPQCGAAPGDRCSGASKHRVRRARGAEYQRLQNEMSQLRETVAKLRQQNELLDEQVHAFRREQRKRVPICSRPTRAGRPCQADAITYPTPIESCRIHLTRVHDLPEILLAVTARDRDPLGPPSVQERADQCPLLVGDIARIPLAITHDQPNTPAGDQDVTSLHFSLHRVIAIYREPAERSPSGPNA